MKLGSFYTCQAPNCISQGKERRYRNLKFRFGNLKILKQMILECENLESSYVGMWKSEKVRFWNLKICKIQLLESENLKNSDILEPEKDFGLCKSE